MPRKSHGLTKTLYTYVKPENLKFVRTQAKKLEIPYSHYVDGLLDVARARSEAAAKAADTRKTA